jgi:hypothetical protein
LLVRSSSRIDAVVNPGGAGGVVDFADTGGISARVDCEGPAARGAGGGKTGLGGTTD